MGFKWIGHDHTDTWMWLEPEWQADVNLAFACPRSKRFLLSPTSTLRLAFLQQYKLIADTHDLETCCSACYGVCVLRFWFIKMQHLSRIFDKCSEMYTLPDSCGRTCFPHGEFTNPISTYWIRRCVLPGREQNTKMYGFKVRRETEARENQDFLLGPKD